MVLVTLYMLAFKRKLILNKAQEQRINSWIGVCRLIYNTCIEIRREGYKNTGKTVHRFDLDAQLKTIRDIDWINDVPFECLSQAVKKMDLAYQKFFRTCKNGATLPKFAKKQKYKHITFRQRISIKERFLKVSKIGYLKMVIDSEVHGKIKTVTIKEEFGSFYAYIVTDGVKKINSQDENQILGLDMGISRLYTDSNGKFSINPQHFKKYKRLLRIEGRSLSRKKKRGKNWIKQVRKLAKLHSKISLVRKDYLHKESTMLARGNHFIIVEDLNISGMVKGSLSAKISDVGWGTFRQMLSYKTNVIAIDPRFTSQICNDCGAKDKKSRISQSEFVCTLCGAKSHADENAAKNILGRGAAIIRERKAIA